MTAPIEDVSSLPGKKVSDQEENPIGEIKEIYAIDGDGYPMWVSVEASFGMGDKKTVFIPIARIKVENDELLVPYSKSHIEQTPEVDADEGITPECDRKLRDHYGIDRADQELRSDNDSYATLVPEDEEGTAQRVEDADKLDTPDANKVDDETRSRLEDVGSAEMRKVTAEDVVDDDDGSPDKKDEKDEKDDEDE
jgi:PRC-barrel domain